MWDFDGGVTTIHIGLVCFVGAWLDLVGCFGVAFVHRAGKVIWMRGGACAAELRLMGVCFCWASLYG